MARLVQILFQIHGRVAERCGRFRPGQADRRKQRGLGMHDPHAAPAAAAGGLDDHRVLDGPGDLDDFLRVVGQRTFGARDDRDAGLGHRNLGVDLVAHQPDRFGSRPDKDEAALFHFLGKVGVFRQEAVAGMNRLRVGDFGRADDRGNVQVALRRRRRADAYRLVGKPHVFGIRVGFRVDDDGLDGQLAARTLDAQRDFAAIGDQHLVEQLSGGFGCHGRGIVGTTRSARFAVKRIGRRQRRRQPMITKGWPYSTACPFSARIALTTPARSASISFISFIASIMQSGSPTCTLSPMSTKALAPGEAER